MLRIRAFEQAAIKAKEEGLVLGAIHPSIGQEAAAVGVCENLKPDDILLSTHRGHGHTLSKGASPEAMMRELLGKVGGNCGGKGGSMHIADFSVGMLGANGVVGANINIAVGAAHAIKLKGEDKLVVCIFGDGAINRGPFLEGLNWAKIFNLPVLFVCEDNAYSATTHTRDTTAGEGPVARAKALGLEAQSIDGNDVVAVDIATQDYIRRVKMHGPHLLHLKTYRLGGHTSTDAAGYRPTGEADEKWNHDPLVRCRTLLTEAGVAVAELDNLEADASREMAAIYATARDAPFPPAIEAYADVQDIGDPRTEAF
ncbi:MAG: thiamine pyrophosphate-dependent dehydrogenase E1 component subunit alpha [Rhodospirillales bacterium]|nr:thiamine pyrophosphate-dependent dehydrogenase E1 component subunit alpha [Rhodospirillales bacterium]